MRIRAAGLKLKIYGRHIWFVNIRVGETETLVEFVLAFRSETRTRRVVGEQRVHDKAQVAGGHLTLLTTVCA